MICKAGKGGLLGASPPVPQPLTFTRTAGTMMIRSSGYATGYDPRERGE